MPEKNFDAWNEVKKQISDYKNNPEPREGEVWFCSIGVNVGHELDGKNADFDRPVLVLTKFSADYFFGIPLSTTNTFGSYFYKLSGRSTLVLIQMKLFDTCRLRRCFFKISKSELVIVRQRVVALILKQSAPPIREGLMKRRDKLPQG
jgi:mRNA interferase MazF